MLHWYNMFPTPQAMGGGLDKAEIMEFFCLGPFSYGGKEDVLKLVEATWPQKTTGGLRLSREKNTVESL